MVQMGFTQLLVLLGAQDTSFSCTPLFVCFSNQNFKEQYSLTIFYNLIHIEI